MATNYKVVKYSKEEEDGSKTYITAMNYGDVRVGRAGAATASFRQVRSDVGGLVVANRYGGTHLSRHRTPVFPFRSKSEEGGRLRPGEAGRTSASLPESGDVELVPSGLGDLENGLPSGADDLGREVDSLSPQGCGIGNHWDYRLRDIFLEALVEEEGQGHDVVECCVRCEALEGESLGAELFERPVHQLVRTPAVVESDHMLGIRPLLQTRCLEQCVDLISHTQIRVDNGVGAGELQQPLTVLCEGSSEEGPAALFPVPSPVSKLEVAPHLVEPLVLRPLTGRDLGCEGLDIVVELARAYVADAEFLKEVKELLVKEAAVEAQHDRHVGILGHSHHAFNIEPIMVDHVAVDAKLPSCTGDKGNLDVLGEFLKAAGKIL